MKNKYSILINTTDSFEDCWTPFFTLFKKYWTDYTGKIYLNTETKAFTFPDLDIISVQNNKLTPNKNITWSQCLINALEMIEEDIILYMQEDYFIKSKVKNEIVENFMLLMSQNDIDCLHLTDQSSSEPFFPSNYEDLWLIDKNASFRISCQAALWRKSVLLQYIRAYENPWQFEKYGTKRAQIFNHKFYTVNRDKYILNKNEIIPYIFTGIVRGCWFEEVIGLFEENNIVIDFTKRGFAKDAIPKSLFFKIKRKIKKIPAEVRSQFELIWMKNTSH
jgi:ABC-type antimicrobial peptide transport system permease subunit